MTRKIYLQKIVPLSVFFALALVCGNIAYKYLSVAFIQVLKSFTPVPLLLANFLMGREHPSLLQLLIVVLISLGVAIATVGELNFSWTGFVRMWAE
jgi:drug/metabolite transporter (DMT)-like permease